MSANTTLKYVVKNAIAWKMHVYTKYTLTKCQNGPEKVYKLTKSALKENIKWTNMPKMLLPKKSAILLF